MKDEVKKKEGKDALLLLGLIGKLVLKCIGAQSFKQAEEERKRERRRSHAGKKLRPEKEREKGSFLIPPVEKTAVGNDTTSAQSTDRSICRSHWSKEYIGIIMWMFPCFFAFLCS